MPNRSLAPDVAGPRGAEHLKVALVEDDPDLLEELAASLGEAGFDVIACPSAEAFWRAHAHTAFDLVALDLGLPREDGMSVLRRLRATTSIGLVVLTARALPSDHALSLSEGADAFLSKPVDLNVLAATLRSVARRVRPSAPMATWRVSADGWSLHAPDGVVVELSPQERLLMTCLMKTPGSAVPREILLECFEQAGEEADPQRLDMMVHRLRKKVAAAGHRLPLRTLYRSGYLFQP